MTGWHRHAECKAGGSERKWASTDDARDLSRSASIKKSRTTDNASGRPRSRASADSLVPLGVTPRRLLLARGRRLSSLPNQAVSREPQFAQPSKPDVYGPYRTELTRIPFVSTAGIGQKSTILTTKASGRGEFSCWRRFHWPQGGYLGGWKPPLRKDFVCRCSELAAHWFARKSPRRQIYLGICQHTVARHRFRFRFLFRRNRSAGLWF